MKITPDEIMDHLEQAETEISLAKTVLCKAIEYFESTDPQDRKMLAFHADTIYNLQDAALHLMCDALDELRTGKGALSA